MLAITEGEESYQAVITLTSGLKIKSTGGRKTSKLITSQPLPYIAFLTLTGGMGLSVQTET